MVPSVRILVPQIRLGSGEEDTAQRPVIADMAADVVVAAEALAVVAAGYAADLFEARCSD